MASLVLPASRFSALLSPNQASVAERTFLSDDVLPLCRRVSGLSGPRRKRLLCDLARSLDESEWHPSATFENSDESSVDWVRDGRRIALRTSTLKWTNEPRRWVVRFSSIQRDRVDELVLAVVTPDGVHLCRHDAAGTLILFPSNPDR